MFMFNRYLPYFMGLPINENDWGPRSFSAFYLWGYSFRQAWPFLAQDIGILLLIVAAFRVVNALQAVALAFGLLLVLAYSFLTMVNLICVCVILALAVVDDAAVLYRSRWLLISAF